MKTPLICPECGELVIAALCDDGRPLVPPHPDRIEPTLWCRATAITVREIFEFQRRQAGM